jgi:hypothetical protein
MGKGRIAADSTVQEVVDALNAVGSSTVPVPVTSNAKSGNYAYSALGAPSVSTLTAGQIIYSNPFAPSGEIISLMGGYFKTGAIDIGSNAYIFLECDLSGGTNYKPVINSNRTFSTALNTAATSYPSFVVNYDTIRGGNYRLAICMGTVTGTATGNTGYNVSVLN